MRTCRVCHTAKAPRHFCRYSIRRGGGLATECKKCANRRSMLWRRCNQARAAASVANWRANNVARRSAVDALWVASHPGRVRATKAKWSRNHPAQNAACTRRRYATKLSATPGWADHIAIGEHYAFAVIKTRLTGVEHEVDHIVPLRSKLVCGLHTDFNLRVISKTNNRKKGNRHWPDMPGEAYV